MLSGARGGGVRDMKWPGVVISPVLWCISTVLIEIIILIIM